MENREKGYVTLLLIILIAFGFLLSGGLMPLLQQAITSTDRYQLVDRPTFTPHNTLQFSTLSFVYNAPPVVCNPGSNFGDEPGILYAFMPGSSQSLTPGGQIKVWYTDEHALTLGKNPGVSPVPDTHVLSNPGVGDTTARDSSNLLYYPGLYITDITNDASSTAGDAQNGGTGIPPSMVYGYWKALGDSDPNCGGGDCNLPAGADQFSSIPSADLNTNTGSRGTETGFQAEIIWNVDSLGLTPGHQYRAQFVIHDGDRDGDIGLGCVCPINF